MLVPQDEQGLLQQAVDNVVARHGGQYQASVRDGGALWQTGPQYRPAGDSPTWDRDVRPGQFIPAEEQTRLSLELGLEINRLRAEVRTAEEQAETPPTAETERPPELPRMVQSVTAAGAVRYTPAPEDHEGPAFYRRETAGGVRYMSEDQYEQYQDTDGGGEGEGGGEEGGSGGRGSGGRRGGAWKSILRGAAIGSVGGGLAAAVAGGLAAPLHQGIALALSGGGGTGAGVTRIAGAITDVLVTGVRLAATAGGAVIGGALGILFGGAIGAIAGTVAGALGGMFSQAGRALGETVGGIVQVFQDAITSSMQLADSTMRLATNMNMSAQSAVNLTTSLQALGVAPQQVESMFGGMGRQLWMADMRLAAFGVTMQRNRDGSLDFGRTLIGIGQALDQVDPSMRPFHARAMMGPAADQLYPLTQNPQIMADMVRAQDELAPSAERIKTLWEQLYVPLNTTKILWQEIKLEFISGFLPIIRSGIGTLTNLWRMHSGTVKAWFRELPARALTGLAGIADWLQQLVQVWGPRLSTVFDGFIGSLNVSIDLVNRLANSRVGQWVIGGPSPAIPGIPAMGGGGEGGPGAPGVQGQQVRAGGGGGDWQRTRATGGGGVPEQAGAEGGGRAGPGFIQRHPLGTGATIAAALTQIPKVLRAGAPMLREGARTAGMGGLEGGTVLRAMTQGGVQTRAALQSATTLARVAPWVARVASRVAAPLAAITTGYEGYREARQGRGVSGGGLLRSMGTGALTGGALAGASTLGIGILPGALLGAVGGALTYGAGRLIGGGARRRAETADEQAAAQRQAQQQQAPYEGIGGAKWGDPFRAMADYMEKTAKKEQIAPLKVEGEIVVRNEVAVAPTDLFNVQLAQYETLQTWRGIQKALA